MPSPHHVVLQTTVKAFSSVLPATSVPPVTAPPSLSVSAMVAPAPPVPVALASTRLWLPKCSDTVWVTVALSASGVAFVATTAPAASRRNHERSAAPVSVATETVYGEQTSNAHVAL